MECMRIFISLQIFILEILPHNLLIDKVSHLSKRSDGSEPKIVNGQETIPHEFPSIVTLRINGRSFCGGTIIAPQWVASAGHCLGLHWQPPNQTIAAGKHRLKDTEDSEQIVRVVKTIRHPGFAFENYVNDIALLKLEHPLEINDKVKPAKLPPKGYNELGTATVVGWGSNSLSTPMSDVLMKLDVPVITNEKCKEIWPNIVRPTIICAGPEDGNGGNPCYGDSGGPLYKTKNGGHMFFGQVAHGNDNCTPSVSYYTRVSEYIDWLGETMSADTGNKQPRVSVSSFVAESLCVQVEKFKETKKLTDPVKKKPPNSSVKQSKIDWNCQCNDKSCFPFQIV